MWMCRARLAALYWVRIRIFRMPLLRQFDIVKSMIRYAPPKGTAGLARSRVNGSKRDPLPPARTTANTSFIAVSLSCPYVRQRDRPDVPPSFYRLVNQGQREDSDGKVAHSRQRRATFPNLSILPPVDPSPLP